VDEVALIQDNISHYAPVLIAPLSNPSSSRRRPWPIAGLKEKLLAALRGGIKTVLIPEENAKDLVEISESIKKGLEIVPVSRMGEVLVRAMTRKPEPIEWDETTTTAAAVPEEAPVEEEVATLTAH
jgi:ATP-dependent Lon protease